MRRALIPLVVLALAASRVDAQLLSDSARSTPSMGAVKSPTAARIIGIIPGAGHMYAGETGRGFAYLGGTLGILAVGSMMVVADCIADALGTEDCGSDSSGDVVAAVALGFWGWSIYDAGRAARRTNARRSLRPTLILAPARSTALAGRDARRVRVGLSFRTR